MPTPSSNHTGFANRAGNVRNGSDLSIFYNGTESLRLDDTTLTFPTSNIAFTQSSGSFVLNEDGNDVDFRIETDGNTHAFVMDAGTNTVAFGSAVLGGSAFRMECPASIPIQSQRGLVHFGNTAPTDSSDSGTIAVMAHIAIRAITPAATNARTYSLGSSLYIDGPPVAGTNVTLATTNAFAIHCHGGRSRFDDGIVVGPLTSLNASIDNASNGSGTTTIYVGNEAITTSSDSRVKTNITPYKDSALDLINQANFIEFNYNLEGGGDADGYGPNGRGRYVGMLAQETVKWAPWAINAGAGLECPECLSGEACDEHSVWHVEYQHLVPLLLKGMQELQAEIDQLKN